MYVVFRTIFLLWNQHSTEVYTNIFQITYYLTILPSPKAQRIPLNRSKCEAKRFKIKYTVLHCIYIYTYIYTQIYS